MPPRPHDPSPLPASGLAELGEGPVWDARLRRLYWVDITQGGLHWLDEGANERETIRLNAPLGFISLTEDPQIVIAGRGASLAWLDVGSAKLTPIVDLEPPEALLRCNDGKPDPRGRLWAGTYASNGSPDIKGSLYSIGHDSRVLKQLDHLGCSNGLAWHLERGELYFIDSPTRRIDRFEWNPDTGDIEGRAPLVSFSEDDGMPDGMCIDAAGHLWVAFWGGACVRRIDGQTGRTLEKIDLPAAQVTSCTFGGPDLATLFVTTASVGLSPEQRAAQPLAGHVFAIRPGVTGLPADRFRGPLPAHN